ncbi:Nse1 non-SMC component of SMC5-6 complex-domain-containing protein [Pisolithus croceorrhizus]|nr:Nse1 non-SMC component of SMC5-6 complex-domain-containing protein [Pisolithus croceorrhizus]KAI6131811.1 Nse1 non-SMC component of SMC5-6 complex-domain-containing protein [Pisolithus croceorrhizus]
MVSSSDVQRLFLQAVFSRGILSYSHALVLWKKCVDAVQAANPVLDVRASDRREDWDAFVNKINDALNPLDLEFRHALDEETGKEMYAVVNTRGDEIAQMATDYSPLEITYFRAVVEQIMLAPNECYSLSSLAALREVNALKTSMTKSQAESVLGSLVARGWLLKSKRGRYSLSTRALLELSPYLKSNYPDECLECTICMEIVTRGVACNTPACQTRMHQYCFRKLPARQARSCPTCQCDWPQDRRTLRPIGEAAIRDGQDEGRRRRRKSTTEASDEEDEEDSRMDGHVPSQSQPSQSQPRRRQTRSAVAMEVDEAEEDDEEEEDLPQTSRTTKSRTESRRQRR